MRIPFIGHGTIGRSKPQNSERLVNLYPEVDASGKATISLIGTPGMTLSYTAGDGPIRAMLVYDDVLYVVSGDEFYSIASNNAVTLRGTLTTSTGSVSIATNGLVILMVDGDDGYTYTISTVTFATIGDVDFPAAPEMCVVCDGYFHVFDGGTQRVHFSTTGTAWDALDFFSSEATPDDLVSMIADHNELILLGIDSVEVRRLSESGWQVIDGAFIEHGCVAKASSAKMDNSVFWLANDYTIRKLSGYTPTRVSTHKEEYRIKQHTLTEIRAATSFTYRDEGHSFYQINIGNETLVYDASTNMWHTRGYMVPATSAIIRHRAQCYALFGGVHLVGDYENGQIYQYDLGVFTDDGDLIPAIGAYRHVETEGYDVEHDQLEIEMETGVGLNGITQGTDPLMMLRWSDDQGQNWGNEIWRKMGAIGAFRVRARWCPLGASPDRVYEFRITDPVKRTILNANLEVTVGK